MMTSKSALQPILLTLLVFAVGIFLQTHLLLNMDVSLLLRTTERMLAGGIYGRDFYESNPPLILYIYAPVVFAAKLFASNFVICFRVYTYLLILISLWLSYYSISKISHNNPSYYKPSILLPAIAFILLIASGVEFGQREHIMVILIMPYCFMTMLRKDKILIPRWLSISAGIFAAIGFCIKPHFFIPLFLLLLYTRRIYTETYIILAAPIIYLSIIFIFHSTYISTIMPLVFKYYYPGFIDPYEPWIHPAVVFFFTVTIIYLISFSTIKTKIVENTLLILASGFFIVYIMQKNSWGYHIYPFMAFSILLSIQMISRYAGLAKSLFNLTNPINISCLITLIIVSAFLLQYPTKYIKNINTDFDFETKILHHLAKFEPGTSVYFLLILPHVYPAIDYLPIKNNQLTQNYWFFPGIASCKSTTNALDSQYLRNVIVGDITKTEPDIIVTNNLLTLTDSSKDIAGFLSVNREFKRFMQKYKIIDVYDHIAIYQHKNKQ